MQAELLLVPRCPAGRDAARLFRAVLDETGLTDVPVRVRTIETEDAARAVRFAGSPAFVVDGTDLFGATPTAGSLACRLYPTPAGPHPLPTPADLRAALRRAARLP